MTKFVLRKEQHKVEILWAMFPDSAMAQKMRFGPNTLSCVICFGIVPYFK